MRKKAKHEEQKGTMQKISKKGIEKHDG